MIEILGTLSAEENKKFAAELSEILLNILSNKLSASPGQIIDNIFLSFFPKMSSVLLIDWGEDSPQWLPDLEEFIRMVRIVPIYSCEAEELKSIAPEERARLLIATIRENWDNPERPAVSFIEATVQNSWLEIKSWVNDNAPKNLERLSEGISEDEINDLEKKMGFDLPKDYKISLKIHNGNCSISDYSYLSAELLFRRWVTMKELMEGGSFNDFHVNNPDNNIITNTWWDLKWIPFAEDSAGNMICIDMNPGVNGVKGQVIYMETHEGPIPSGYKSFTHWLDSYKNDLYGGLYLVDEEGFISPK